MGGARRAWPLLAARSRSGGGSGGWSWPGKGGAPALGLPRFSAPCLLSGHAPLPGPSPLCSPQGDALHVSAFSAASRLPDALVRLAGCVFYSPLPLWAGWADITDSAFWLGGMGRWLPTGSEHPCPIWRRVFLCRGRLMLSQSSLTKRVLR